MMHTVDLTDKGAPVHDPPPLAWEAHARAGSIADAIAAYVQHFDWVTFAELSHRLRPYVETTGHVALELRPNVVIWVGTSEAFADAVTTLISEHRVFLHPCTTLSYLIDGGLLRMPVAKSPPASGYRRPHWLPVALRVVPIKPAKGTGRRQVIEVQRKAVRP